MGYKSLTQRIKESKTSRRDIFRHRFDTMAKVIDFVKRQGDRADIQLRRLYEVRHQQKENVAVFRVVGGDLLEKAESDLWYTNYQIQYEVNWQMLRDCVAAKLLSVEITGLYLHFHENSRPKQRICRFGPHGDLEFNQDWHRTRLLQLSQTAVSGEAVSPTGLQRGGGKA